MLDIKLVIMPLFLFVCYLWCPWGRCSSRRSLCPGRCLRFGTAGSDIRWCWSHTAGRCIQACSGSWRRPGRQCRYRSGMGSSDTHRCPCHSASQSNLPKKSLIYFSNWCGCVSTPFLWGLKSFYSIISAFVKTCIPSVHSQVYLLGPSVHLAPFLHGVLAHSSMSIWQRFPVKPGKTTRVCMRAWRSVQVCVFVCVCVYRHGYCVLTNSNQPLS